VNLTTDNSIDQLRQAAVILEAQNKHLLKVLAAKCHELDELKGRSGDLQNLLAGLESVGRANAGAEAG
jgi:hypothetical protein